MGRTANVVRCVNCGTIYEPPTLHSCPDDSTLDEQAALAHREEERDHCVHLVRMLRVTLAARADRCDDASDSARRDALVLDAAYHAGKRDAYRDVLSLLGPEEPEQYDPEAPF